MAGEISGREVVGNMEYLLKLLHKEWERSGRTKVEVTINISDVRTVYATLGAAIQKMQGQIELELMTFQESMKLTKENFVLLRLIRKIKKAVEKAEQGEADTFLAVELDVEEYRLFSTLIKTEEA